MTTFTDTWNATFESVPADVGEAISTGPARIRALKVAISERLEVDHSWAGDGDDGKHKWVTWLDQASTPATPDSGESVAFPRPIGADTGLHTRFDTGFFRPGVDGGVNSLSNADQTLNASGSDIGQYFYMTPTVQRSITLPTTNVAKGYKLWISNQATSDPEGLSILVKSSNGNTVRRVLPGQTVWFQADAAEPTDPTTWSCEKGLIYADEASTPDTEYSFSIPKFTVRGDGSGLHIRVLVNLGSSQTITATLNGETMHSTVVGNADGFIEYIVVRTSATAGESAVNYPDGTGDHTSLSALDWTASQTLVIALGSGGAGKAITVEAF